MTISIAAIRRDQSTRQFVKFVLVGSSTTVIYLGLLFILLHDPFGVRIIYPIAVTLAFVPATLNSYFFNRRWTFRAGRHRNEMLAKFFTIQSTSFVVNLTVVAFLIEQMGFETQNQKFIAAVIGNGFIVATNFIGNKFWTFRR